MIDNQSIRYVFATALRLAFTHVGFLGFVFIVYGSITEITGERWAPLERIAEPLSSALTILGTVVVAISIYFFGPKATPPEQMSVVLIAPVLIRKRCF